MGIPRFFKIPQHKRFHYEPIYYDERKERLEERIRQIEQEYGIKNGEDYTPTIRKGFISHYYSKRKKAQRYSTTRLIIILIFLGFITYYLFFA